jgi:hypothetical protein
MLLKPRKLKFDKTAKEWGSIRIFSMAQPADFDSDGDLDLVVNNINDLFTEIIRKSYKASNYLRIELSRIKLITPYSDQGRHTSDVIQALETYKR